jgi:hypothetical protein
MRHKPTRYECRLIAFLRSGGRPAILLAGRRLLHSQNAGSQDLPNFGQQLLCAHVVWVWAPWRPSDPRLRGRIKLHHENGVFRQQGEQHLSWPRRLPATLLPVYQGAFRYVNAGREVALRQTGSLPDRPHIDRCKFPMVSAGVWVAHLRAGYCDLQLFSLFSLVLHRRLPFSIRSTPLA